MPHSSLRDNPYGSPGGSGWGVLPCRSKSWPMIFEAVVAGQVGHVRLNLFSCQKSSITAMLGE